MRERLSAHWSELWREQLARRGAMGLIGDLWILSVFGALFVGFLLGWVARL